MEVIVFFGFFIYYYIGDYDFFIFFVVKIVRKYMVIINLGNLLVFVFIVLCDE